MPLPLPLPLPLPVAMGLPRVDPKHPQAGEVCSGQEMSSHDHWTRFVNFSCCENGEYHWLVTTFGVAFFHCGTVDPARDYAID
jgi:hypothetical protein